MSEEDDDFLTGFVEDPESRSCRPTVHPGIARNSSNVMTRLSQHCQPLVPSWNTASTLREKYEMMMGEGGVNGAAELTWLGMMATSFRVIFRFLVPFPASLIRTSQLVIVVSWLGRRRIRCRHHGSKNREAKEVTDAKRSSSKKLCRGNTRPRTNQKTCIKMRWIAIQLK